MEVQIKMKRTLRRLILMNTSKKMFNFSEGDRIGQMLIFTSPHNYILQEETLAESDRGLSAHYSTGV